jgi:hypothetical protein
MLQELKDINRRLCKQLADAITSLNNTSLQNKVNVTNARGVYKYTVDTMGVEVPS